MFTIIRAAVWAALVAGCAAGTLYILLAKGSDAVRDSEAVELREPTDAEIWAEFDYWYGEGANA